MRGAGEDVLRGRMPRGVWAHRSPMSKNLSRFEPKGELFRATMIREHGIL